jgi:hypothetical protein
MSGTAQCVTELPAELTVAGLILIRFENLNIVQTVSNLNWLKRCLPKFKKFQIKYGCQGIKIRNNFTYRNFSIFEKYSELKFKGASRV